jgi:hypothetical protein
LSVEDRRQILEDLDQGKITWEEAQARLRGEKYTEPAEPEAEGGGK